MIKVYPEHTDLSSIVKTKLAHNLLKQFPEELATHSRGRSNIRNKLFYHLQSVHNISICPSHWCQYDRCIILTVCCSKLVKFRTSCSSHFIPIQFVTLWIGISFSPCLNDYCSKAFQLYLSDSLKPVSYSIHVRIRTSEWKVRYTAFYTHSVIGIHLSVLTFSSILITWLWLI